MGPQMPSKSSPSGQRNPGRPASNGSNGTTPSVVQGGTPPTPGATRFNNPTKSDPNSGSRVKPGPATAQNLSPVRPYRPGTAPMPGNYKRTPSGT